MTFRYLDLRLWAPTICLLSWAVGCSAASSSDAKSEDDEAASEAGDDISLGQGEGDADGGPILSNGDANGGAGGASAGTCLSFMSWGVVAQEGAVPGEAGMDAIVSWLNVSSTGSGTHFAQKPEITDEFLRGFDLVLLQNLAGWEFSDNEIRVFQNWVKAGGGVMALSGYSAEGGQVLITNRLLSFTGLNYVAVASFDTALSVGATCGYCLGSTHKQEGFNSEHPISAGVTAVGAFQGRSIQGDGQIVAQEDGKVLGMTTRIESGRVFLFHDDWVSYNSQWDGKAPSECAENQECKGISTSATYQVPQFWYNAFRYLVPQAECFDVTSDLITR